MCGCLSHTPYWGPGPQPRHVLWLGIEPPILWFTGCTRSTEPHQPGPQHHLLKRLSLLCNWSWHPKIRSFDHIYVDLILGSPSCSIGLYISTIPLCQYLTVLIIVALWYVLKSGRVSPPSFKGVFIISQVCFGYLRLFVVPYEFCFCYYKKYHR